MINTCLDKTFPCVLTSLFADSFSLWGQQRTAVNWEGTCLDSAYSLLAYENLSPVNLFQ